MSNWFMRPSSTGLANGTDWNNAWSITNLNSNWGSVAPGDTIWLAGGSYTTGIEIGASGTAGNVITLKRATVANHGSDTGWNPAFDAQVIIAPTGGNAALLWFSGVGDYVTVDGVSANGIKLKYDNTGDPFLGAVDFGGSSTYHDIIIRYCDIAGPGTGTYGNPVSFVYNGDNAPILVKGSGDVYNVTFSHCDVHSGPNLIQAGYIGVAYNWTLEYCRFFDNVSGNPSIHANVFYLGGTHDWTIRYCDFSGWHVEGIGVFGVTVSMNFYVYGNVFHDQVGVSASCFWNSSVGGGVDGPLYLYNNTFYGVTITNGQASDRPFGSGSSARNNIYWNSFWVDAIADSDYNFSDASGTGKGGTHSITNGVNAFVNPTVGDFHIISTIGTTHPRNKGVLLSSSYNTDVDGNIRGVDGSWDIGAYEFIDTSDIGILTLKTFRPVSATISSTGSLAALSSHIGAFLRNFSANLGFVGITRRSIGKRLTATLSLAGLFIRSFTRLKGFASTLSFGNLTNISRTLTVNHTLVPSTQTDFPVLVSITDATLATITNGGHVRRSDGFDIGFYSDSGLTTKLKWDVERYTPTTGELIASVKIPSLSSSVDTVFYMSYGDVAITTDQSDSVNVWTNSYLGVYHLGNGTTLNVNSSTGANNGINSGTTATVGQVDGGASFASASSQFITLTNGLSSSAITLSAWVKGTTFATDYSYVLERGFSGSDYWGIAVKSNGKLLMTVFAASFRTYDGTGSNTLSAGTWYYLTLTYSSVAGLVGYVNATVDGTVPANGVVDPTLIQAEIGRQRATGTRYWNGQIDEVRFSSVVRSADWITTEYRNQNAPGAFMSLGAEVGGTVPATLDIRIGKSLTGTLTFAGGLVRHIRALLASTLSFVGNLVIFLITVGGEFALSLSANLLLVGRLNRTSTRALTASTLSFSATVFKRTVRNFVAVLIAAGSLAEIFGFAKFLTATVSFVGSLTHSTPFRQLFTATLAFSGNVRRTFVMSLVAALLFIGQLTKQTNRVFRAVLSFIGTLVRGFVGEFRYYIDLRPNQFKPTSTNFRTTKAESSNFRYVKTNDDS